MLSGDYFELRSEFNQIEHMTCDQYHVVDPLWESLLDLRPVEAFRCAVLYSTT